jgi:hypothetical protein
MTEPASTPPAGGSQEPQAGAPAAPAPAATPQQPPAGGEPPVPVDLAIIQRELAATRREAAGYRVKLKQFEDRDKSDSEKAAERVAELEKQLAEAHTARQGDRLQMATFAAARKLGYRNPEIAHRLLSPSEVEFTDDGAPKNVEQLLATLAKSEPYLVSAGQGDAGLGPRGAPTTPDQDMNTIIRRATGRQ